jgi:hypothetical protein
MLAFLSGEDLDLPLRLCDWEGRFGGRDDFSAFDARINMFAPRREGSRL